MSRKSVFLAVIFEGFFFFLPTHAEKKYFRPVKSLYFCVVQQKQKKNRLKRTSKKNRCFGGGRVVSASGSETSVSSSTPASAIIYDAYTSLKK